MAPQQLSGGPKYSARTLIGNWSEEISLNKAKLDDFKERTASGSSNLKKLQNKITKCTAKVFKKMIFPYLYYLNYLYL